LPHRDHNHAESNAEDGSPEILSIWIPLNDVDTQNGCMYVVPKEFDEYFDKPEDDSHLKAAMWKDTGRTELRFDLACGRPLPAKAGSTLGWHGNLIHWGSKYCSPFPPFCQQSIETQKTTQQLFSVDVAPSTTTPG